LQRFDAQDDGNRRAFWKKFRKLRKKFWVSPLGKAGLTGLCRQHAIFFVGFLGSPFRRPHGKHPSIDSNEWQPEPLISTYEAERERPLRIWQRVLTSVLNLRALFNVPRSVSGSWMRFGG
jgi:hypothetical protein